MKISRPPDLFVKIESPQPRCFEGDEDMDEIIQQQAEHLGYEICQIDIEAIKNRHFHSLHRNGQVWIQGVRSAIRAYFE